MAFALAPPRSSAITAFAVLVILPAFSAVAGAAEPAPADPGAVTSVPEPEPDTSAISAENTGPEAGTEAPPPEAGAVPEPEAGGAAPPPSAGEAPPIQTPTPPPEATAPPATSTEPEPAVDPTLLDAAETEPLAPIPTTSSSSPAPRSGLSPEERAAAIDAAYAERYRPADNPVRLNIAARLLFANASGKEGVNGRVGGASVDIGPSWNRIGVAATFTGWGGRIQLQEDLGTEMNAMLGGGLSLSLGRLALMSHGYLDLRAGYDVYYGAVNQRGDSPSIVAAQDDDPRVTATLTENLLPHGPRVRLDMGLVGSTNRKFFHGFGLSMGYQALVGSFRGDLPVTNMLTLGFSYFMG